MRRYGLVQGCSEMKYTILSGFVFVFCFCSIISTGCRMCGTCYDECVPSKTARPNDSDSCNPLYRAGSVFYGNTDYTDISNIADCEGCSLTNAGYYGKTYAVDKNRPSTAPKRNTPPTGTDHWKIPTIQDLLRGRPTEPPTGTVPPPQTLPQQQSVPPPNQTMSVPARPAIQPKVTRRTGLPPAGTSAPQFSVEELRKMENDPSVTDIRIINVEDAVDSAFQ